MSRDSIRETVSGINSEKFKINADVHCTSWDIGRSIAENTIKATIHLRVQTVNHPNVERRWPTGARQLQYRRLDHAVYHDTMYSQVKSSRGNKCCKFYVTDFGWSRSFPMTKESEVHETLDLFLRRYGIRLASKWTIKSQSPRRVWDRAIELASIVRSHLALDMYKIKGQVPETIMLSQTADIAFICSFAWYNWVYYN
jgi:hypothetical protein